MPYTDTGEWREPTNTDRCEWAGAALKTYASLTMTGEFDVTDAEAATVAAEDLISDLLHLIASLDGDPDYSVESARGHFEYEQREVARS